MIHFYTYVYEVLRCFIQTISKMTDPIKGAFKQYLKSKRRNTVMSNFYGDYIYYIRQIFRINLFKYLFIAFLLIAYKYMYLH